MATLIYVTSTQTCLTLQLTSNGYDVERYTMLDFGIEARAGLKKVASTKEEIKDENELRAFERGAQYFCDDMYKALIWVEWFRNLQANLDSAKFLSPWCPSILSVLKEAYTGSDFVSQNLNFNIQKNILLNNCKDMNLGGVVGNSGKLKILDEQ